MRLRRQGRALAATMVLAMASAAFVSSGATTVSAAAPASVIPHADSAWIYDGASGVGVWAQSIAGYNAGAGANNKITQIYSYGTDIEAYADKGTVDEGTYYDGSNKDNGIWDTAAYWAALDQGPQLAKSSAPAVSISPIIDGTTGDFNLDSISPTQDSAFADEIADEVCADDNLSGIQFDYEPFNAQSAGQQAFYTEINTDFDSATYGCVDAAHPNGRYFSVFGFGSALATNGTEIKTMLGNDGYFIASLYDLGTNGAGIQNGTGSGPNDYPALVQTAVNTTAWYADQNNIPYAFGIPAAASDHEFVNCFGSPCTMAADDGTDSNGMLDYTKAAVAAIDSVVNNTDSLFVGTDIWDFGVWTGVNRPNNLYTRASGTSFDVQPASAPTAVLQWLQSNLPSYQHTGGAGPTSPGSGGGGTGGGTGGGGTGGGGTGGGGTNVLSSADNPGFEGTLSPWTCTSGAADSTTNVYAGTGALALTPSSTLTAYCQQTITGLTPSHPYTFSAELAGGSSPITLALDQGSTDVASSTGSSYAPVSGTVTTDATGNVTLRIQAYKQQSGTGYADNLSLVSQ
jgi:hypothetical protein